MEAAAPALLSGLSELLLRRPPSLRELVTVIGYADDYAWFAGLVCRLFPDRAEAVLSAPDLHTRVERFANLFGERHFPLYAPYFEFWTEMEGEEPPWSWLRRGIPFDLMGFGYDGLHEMWNGYRDGISALLLLARPPDSFYGESDEIRVAWLESAAEHIPQSTLERVPPGRHTRRGVGRGSEGDPVRGGGQGRLLGLRRDGQPLPRPLLRRRVFRRVLRPLGRRHHRRGHGGVAQGQRPHGLGVQARRLAGGGPSPAASPRCWTSRWRGYPNKNRRKTTMSNDAEKTEWSLPGPADAPRDNLKLQLEVYGETILLRGFESDSTWVRTVSADEISGVFTQHLGFSSGLLPQDALWWNQGEDRAGGCPLEAAAGAAGGPAAGGVQAPRTAPASHAGAGLRLLAGPRALGLRGPEPP